MTIKFFQMLGFVFLLGGLIAAIFAVKYYKDKKVKEVSEEIKIIDKETPDTSSNIDTYRKAEGITVDEEEEENMRASFLGHAEPEIEEWMPVENSASEEDEEESEETGALREDKDEDDGTTSLNQFIPDDKKEEYNRKEPEEEENDVTVALNTGTLRRFEEKIEEEDDKTGVLMKEAEF